MVKSPTLQALIAWRNNEKNEREQTIKKCKSLLSLGLSRERIIEEARECLVEVAKEYAPMKKSEYLREINELLDEAEIRLISDLDLGQ
jgi:hypothetical protein